MKKPMSSLLPGIIPALLMLQACTDVRAASSHYDPVKKVFFSPGMTHSDNGQSHDRPGLIGDVKIFWRLAFSNDENQPPCRLPVITPRWNEFLRNDGTDRFIWFGHSTILMHLSSQNVMIDPVFGSASPFNWLFPRWQPAPADRSSLPSVNTILVSHNHYDHFEEETARFYAGKTAHYVVPLGLGHQLRDWGVPEGHITELDWYQTYEKDGVRYTAVPSQHISGRELWDANKTLWAGWVIETPDHRYYYSGDTGYGRHFSDIRKHFGGFDLAFIENGQYDRMWADDHMTPQQTVEAARDLGAAAFVPVHWGAYAMAFHKWNQPVMESAAASLKAGVHEITPMMGEVFSTAYPVNTWWKGCPVGPRL